MKENIMIVEDEFIVANDLKIMLGKAGYGVCGIAASVQEAKKMVELFKPTWVMLDIFLQHGSMGTDLAGYLSQRNIGFIYVSANTNQSILEKAKATQPYGFLVKPFRERDLLTMLDIAREKHKHHLQLAVQRETMLLSQMALLNTSRSDQPEKLRQLASVVQPHIPFDVAELSVNSAHGYPAICYYLIRTGFNEYQVLTRDELLLTMRLSGQELSSFQRKSESPEDECYNGLSFQETLGRQKRWRLLATHFRLASSLKIDICERLAPVADITFFSRNNDQYTNAHLSVLKKAKESFSAFLKALNTQTDGKPAVVLQQDRNRSADKQNAQGAFGQIIGNSRSLVRVLDSINMVASAQVSVLITGESGTGKERAARSIHELSPRKNKPLITVNCAALPFELIESELFGHEKGSFTGATDKRSGKFELADGGSIFLDEVGELPLDAQVKLLRVLQEKEIEHLGGSKTIKVDVRVIAATNRKLEKEVAEGRFRLDLYYRLNVFPIELPPLRDRKEDIPVLAEHFAKKYGEELGKPISGLSKNAMNKILAYHWPGNIRELEHLIQRSVIMAADCLVENVEIPEVPTGINSAPAPFQLKTLDQSESDHILGVLKHCNGKVCGPGGAAEILGVPPSTLNSRIKKLGIRRDDYFIR